MASDYLFDFRHPKFAEDEAEIAEAMKPLEAICAKHDALREESERLGKEYAQLDVEEQKERTTSLSGTYTPRTDNDETLGMYAAGTHTSAELAERNANTRRRTEQMKKLQQQIWDANAKYQQVTGLVTQRTPGGVNWTLPACCQIRVESERRIREEVAQREAPLLEQLRELREADDYLVALKGYKEQVTQREQQLAAELERLRTEKASVADDEQAGRRAWDEAATAVAFPGRPSVDLPPLPPRKFAVVEPEARAWRDKPTLLVGINATEKDVAQRALEENMPFFAGPLPPALIDALSPR